MKNRLLKRALPIVTVLCLCHCSVQREQKEAERYILESERQRAAPVATGDTSHCAKGVVQRPRRNADHVRLAKIAFHTCGDEFSVHLLWLLVRLDRQLRAARTRVRRGDEREFL